MTKENAIKILTYIKNNPVGDGLTEKAITDTQEVFDMAIKALEQEPKTDLDKIRAEIAELEERITEVPNMAEAYATVLDCLDIIDKYRGEV